MQKKRNTTKEQNLNAKQSVNANKEKEVNHKQATYTQSKNRITWTVEDNATIVRMIVGGSAYAEIALAMGKGLERNDISNRW